MAGTKIREQLMEKANSLCKDTADVSINDKGYIALSGNVIDVIKGNLKNQPISLQLFDVVKAPSGGATVFTIPGVTGDEIEKELTGIILDYSTPRAYWENAEPVEGTPPDCFSTDSMVSHNGKICASCPFNTYGSKNGDSGAKACKETVVLYLLRPNNIMPLVVRVPVSSKLIFQKYAARLAGKMLPVNSVVTHISLEKKVSRSGQTYASYAFEMVEELSAEQSELAWAYSRQLMTAIVTEESNMAKDVS